MILYHTIWENFIKTLGGGAIFADNLLEKKRGFIVSIRRALVALVVSSIAISSFADDLEWVDVDGTTDPSTWPTSGNVHIFWKSPYNKVYIGDEQASIVEGWDNLHLDTGAAYIIFTNYTRAINLKANVKGNGFLQAWDSVGLTLSGDNSGRSANGNIWSFSNSTVVVAHEYGLGPANAKYAEFKFTHTDASARGSLRFKWGDENLKVYTNHCPIVYTPVTKYYGYNTDFGSDQMRFGPTAIDEKYVQDGDFMISYHGGGDRRLYLRGNVEFMSGVFGTCNGTGSPVYRGNMLYVRATPAVSGGGTSYSVTFSGNTFIRVGETTGSLRRDGFYLSAPGEVHFGHSGGTHATVLNLDLGSVFADCDGLFENPVTDNAMMTWGWYHQDQSTYKNSLNLQGHDVKFRNMTFGNTAPTATSKSYTYMTSAIPATVSLIGDFSGANCSKVAVEMRGAVSFVVDNNATNYIARRVSDTLGTLTVKTGVLEYLWEGGWGGTNIVVKSGGRLRFADTSCGITRAKSELSVEDGGVLELGLNATVYRAYVDGEPIMRGTYGAIGSGAANEVGWIEGAGLLSVTKSPSRGLQVIVQ